MDVGSEVGEKGLDVGGESGWVEVTTRMISRSFQCRREYTYPNAIVESLLE